ncbi:MAG: integrase repeat-containing protein, partial [Patescibacteria group bacterium]|nr:integrase repeat-containing protein [Patescibacteria group bacterium]
RVYKDEWKNWYDFLGKEKPLEFLSFEEAKEVVRNLGIKSSAEYFQKYKQVKGLPSNPRRVYKDEWKNWRDFLGKEKSLKFLPFEEAKKIVKTLNIMSQKEYFQRYKEGKGLPSDPRRVYKDEWKNWRDFLGKEKPLEFLSFEEAKKIVKTLNIMSQKEYFQRYKEGKGLPSDPRRVYKDEWKNWRDFLGTEKKN